MNDSNEEKIVSLSTFFYPKMSTKSSKKSTTSILNRKLVAPAKGKSKSKPISSSESDSSSDSDSSGSESSEPIKKAKSHKSSKSKSSKSEPIKRSKSKSSKKVESSSSESDDDGIALENLPEQTLKIGEEVLSRLADGLLEIANQMSIANDNNAKIIASFATLLLKFEEREQRNEMRQHIKDEVEERGESFDGNPASSHNFTKSEEIVE